MSPRLPSATTSRFAARAYSQTSSKARRPSAPIVSKYASWAFTPTTYGATASMSPRQKRATASAAALRLTWTSPRSSTGRSSGRGSSPTRSWLRLRSTASATRSPNASVPGGRVPSSTSWAMARSLVAAVPGVLGHGGARIAQRVEDCPLVEGEDGELGRRSPQERPEQQELLGALRREGGLRRPGGGDPRSHLEHGAGARREGARRGDPAARHEDGAREARLGGGRQEAALRGAQALERGELAHDLLERANAVAEARGVLVAEAVGQVAEAPVQARERASVQEAGELLLARAVEGPRRPLGPAAAPDRPERAGPGGDDDPTAARLEVDALPAALPARVGRRPELADEAQLLEGGLELRPQHPPFDALHRAEGGLDG